MKTFSPAAAIASGLFSAQQSEILQKMEDVGYHDLNIVNECRVLKFRGCGKVMMMKMRRAGWIPFVDPEYEREKELQRIENMKSSIRFYDREIASSQGRIRRLKADRKAVLAKLGSLTLGAGSPDGGLQRWDDPTCSIPAFPSKDAPR